MAKGIPYGISDFSRLIDQNYYYVDKTHFIPQIEEIANYLLFVPDGSARVYFSP